MTGIRSSHAVRYTTDRHPTGQVTTKFTTCLICIFSDLYDEVLISCITDCMTKMKSSCRFSNGSAAPGKVSLCLICMVTLIDEC